MSERLTSARHLARVDFDLSALARALGLPFNLAAIDFDPMTGRHFLIVESPALPLTDPAYHLLRLTLTVHAPAQTVCEPPA